MWTRNDDDNKYLCPVLAKTDELNGQKHDGSSSEALVKTKKLTS